MFLFGPQTLIKRSASPSDQLTQFEGGSFWQGRSQIPQNHILEDGARNGERDDDAKYLSWFLIKCQYSSEHLVNNFTYKSS